MRELALFAGAGGGILGGKLLGWKTVCAVEIDPHCQRVLMQRQDDGILEPFPIWDDVRTFRGLPWRGSVDVVSGGFPCQDISAAGSGAGITGERSGLWTEFARIIGEVQPPFAFVENSPMLTSRGLGVVLGDLAELGMDARWGVFSAAGCGAPHLRRRIWIVANARSRRLGGENGREVEQLRRTEVVGAGEVVADAQGVGWLQGRPSANDLGDTDRLRELQSQGSECIERGWPSDSSWWAVEPGFCQLAYELAERLGGDQA